MKTINEIQACFLISLIAHTGLIGAGILNINYVKDEQSFEVEFEIEEILPDRYELKEEKKIEKPIAEEEVTEPAAEEKIEPEETDKELIKSLLRYQDSIKQKIQEEKQYPRWALRNGHEGLARVEFDVLPSGYIKDLKITKFSGFEELDKEALDAVKRAGPFLSFPAELNENEIKIKIEIVFLIQKPA